MNASDLMRDDNADFISEHEAKAMATKSAPAIERARRLKAVTKNECPNCNGNSLLWHIGTKGPSDVPDGRIRMSEVNAIAYLACEECSETLRVIDSDEIETLLNAR